ncbi:MAG TPA: alginate export family protein [Burkholderiales bacterium]|nr:alginate export family protein [Burkholderiales bacterium]
MGRIGRWLSAALVCSACGAGHGQELDSPLVAASPLEALRDGDLLLELRPRYTWVDQEGRPEEASWGSLRTRLGWKTLEYRALSAVIEGINVARFADSGYIDYGNTPGFSAGTVPSPYGVGYYPLIADPKTTDFNRLYLDYTGLPHTLVRFGRQLVRIDNQRFIGDYDFAQLPQAFNGVVVENAGLSRLRLTAGYFARVRNTFAAQADTDTIVLHARYEPSPLLKLAGYAYLQDQPNTGSVTGFADNSNQILGARLWGGWKLGEALELLYGAELAEQRDYADGDPRIDAPYRRVGGGLAIKRGYLRVDWELLGSNAAQYGFQTPLGSTQLFTGRADIFASTPSRGLEDLRTQVGVDIAKATLHLEYHRFRSDFADWDLGSEWDFGVAWTFTRRLSAGVEFADYRAGDPRAALADTRKVWVTVGYRH